MEKKKRFKIFTPKIKGFLHITDDMEYELKLKEAS